MNISTIQTFLAVYRLGNLNRAADELNITQSAVTARLDALEASMGVRLLNRSRKGATLTKAGYAFLEHASLITRNWSAARAKVALPKGVETLFSFVCEPSLWDDLGCTMIDRWRINNPGIAFEIWTARSNEASQWLSSGMSDAALMTDPLPGSDLTHCEILTETISQVSTVKRDAVEWDTAYVFVDYGLAFRDWHSETWPVDKMAAISFSNPIWASDHIFRHGGSAYLPERLVEAHAESRHLFPVRNAPSYTRKLYLTWRKQVEPQFQFLRSEAD